MNIKPLLLLLLLYEGADTYSSPETTTYYIFTEGKIKHIQLKFSRFRGSVGTFEYSLHKVLYIMETLELTEQNKLTI